MSVEQSAISSSMLHVALVEPEIPPNTGNVARLCAATRVPLHIVGVPAFRLDDRAVRRAATMAQVPCITTLTGASASVSAIRALRTQGLTVRSLQDYYAGIATGA
jgi:tRNA(Leu) C34 or U34 (ribose-2'-O)-methylase TrmL